MNGFTLRFSASPMQRLWWRVTPPLADLPLNFTAAVTASECDSGPH
eukprot:gene35790-32652_t